MDDAASDAELVDVVVEIPRGSRNKYEQADDGVLWFDRRLGGPVGFPGDYGYVVGAVGEDGDNLDALVLLDEATFPAVRIRCRVLGAFLLDVDEKLETKMICVPLADHHQDHLRDLTGLPDDFIQELDSFFHAYRVLEATTVRVVEHLGRSTALAALGEARERAPAE